MCTVTFKPKQDGYLVAMNRDEQRTRVKAHPPEIFEHDAIRAAYPFESHGGERGTWIAVNEHCLTFALLNRSLPHAAHQQVSRGTLIPSLLHCRSLADVLSGLQETSYQKMRPFRLICFAPADRAISEWRWDGTMLEHLAHEWSLRAWYSSGWGDEKAEQGRAPAFDAAELTATDEAVRRFHASHLPSAGAFSVCVHREDACTVSYTEIEADEQIDLRYWAGNPCEALAHAPVSISLERNPHLL